MRLASICQLAEAFLLSLTILYLTRSSVHRCVHVKDSPHDFHFCGQLLQMTAQSDVHLRVERSNRSYSLTVKKNEGKVCTPVDIPLLTTDFGQMRHVSYSIHALYLSLILLSFFCLFSLLQMCWFPMWSLRGSFYVGMAFHLLVLALYYLAHYALHLESHVWATQEKFGVEFPSNWNWARITTLALALIRLLQGLCDKFLNNTHVGVSHNVTLFDFSKNINYTNCPAPESARNTGTKTM